MEQPTFNGRDIAHWLGVRLSGEDEARWEAVDAIRHLCGPETSVPLLLDTLLKDQYWRARCLAAHALFDLAMDREEEVNWTDLMPQLQSAALDPSEEVRGQIAELLTVLSAPKDETHR